jgi:hypothetical protein
MTDRIRAPWTEAQVAALNAFQRSGVMPPFTCRAEHRMRPTLYAEPDGWRCPDEQCDYRQTWAHAFMADPVTVERAAILHNFVKDPALVELARVRGQLRETEKQLGEERRRTAELTARLTALQVHEAIQRIPAPAAPPRGEILRGQTINDVPTGGQL